MKEGEHRLAFDYCRRHPLLRFHGVHVHIGTGCKSAADYARVFRLIGPALLAARDQGLETRCLDFGGGYGSATAREFTSLEFLRYIGFGRLPPPPEPARQATFAEFAERISSAVESFCGEHGLPLPSLILEPGRALVSSNIFLLLSVLDVGPPKRGVSLVVTDGGRWTTTLQPTYEYHELFLCNDVSARRSERYTIAGSHAFGGDIITRNRRLPALEVGDVLALMDSGAYFTSMESNFGHPRPPYVAVRDGKARLLRRREEPEDMLARDAALPSRAR
jgi:diaminopimelate decarboxylase